MARTAIYSFLLLILGLTHVSCVSVNIGPKKAGRAENIRTSPPGNSFQSISETAADQAWQSQKTGNTISYLSECPEPAMSLELLTSESLAVLKNNHVIEQKTKFFNGREALATRAEGTLDGIGMKMQALVFKRNGCSFLITYAARKDRFNDELHEFTQFLESFQAP